MKLWNNESIITKLWEKSNHNVALSFKENIDEIIGIIG